MKRLILLLALLAMPVVAWTSVKSVRVLAPGLAGVFCAGRICIDRPPLRPKATGLYQDALEAVTGELGAFDSPPRVIFCSTRQCFETFGGSRSAAKNFGTSGIVIAPRGWHGYYLRHEMIHHLQNEHLGVVKMWLSTPKWFTEGMAYALSDDPRDKLTEPWESYRSRFEAWYAKIDKKRLWQEASGL